MHHCVCLKMETLKNIEHRQWVPHKLGLHNVKVQMKHVLLLMYSFCFRLDVGSNSCQILAACSLVW